MRSPRRDYLPPRRWAQTDSKERGGGEGKPQARRVGNASAFLLSVGSPVAVSGV